MYSGAGVCKGVVSGKLYFCKDSSGTYEKESIQNVELEKEYVRRAFESTVKELNKLYEIAKEKVGVTVAMIIEGHRCMAEDKGCFEQILSLIELEKVNAEWAIQQVFNQYIEKMKNSMDTYLKARAADFEDLLNRLEYELAKVKGSQKIKQEFNKLPEKFLALGKQFSVEDILSLYEKGAAGILDLSGDEESHALVVAKSLELPMIIQVEEGCLNYIGCHCRMDGACGSVEAE